MPTDRSTGPPHVTELLAKAGLIDTQWFRDFDLERGTALHRAAHYLDLGDLDWSTVDPLIAGRLRQYQRFKDEVRPVIVSAEEKVSNQAYNFCGTLDRRVFINGRLGILDIKGPSRAPWQALQLALYALCFPGPLARWTLHLSDERYMLIEHADPNDYAAAKAAVTLVAWRERHGC